MADYNGPKQERIKNALDNRKLHLSAPCPSAEGKTSTLMWSLIANNPRMIVWTNDPADTGESNGYGKITANLDAPTFVTFLNLLTEVVDGPTDKKEYIENKNYIFPGGKRSEHPVLVSTLYCGKDKEGLVWMSLVAKNRPIVKFIFGEGEFHHFFNGDGTAADKGKVSQRYAKAYIKLLYGIMEQLFVSLYTEPEKKANSNWSGGNKASNSHQMDDIPF